MEKAIKDCQYNNKDVNLPKVNTYNKSQLTYDISINPKPTPMAY
jgi:hypothetical protein